MHLSVRRDINRSVAPRDHLRTVIPAFWLLTNEHLKQHLEGFRFIANEEVDMAVRDCECKNPISTATKMGQMRLCALGLCWKTAVIQWHNWAALNFVM
jgi:hypothetical protein